MCVNVVRKLSLMRAWGWTSASSTHQREPETNQTSPDWDPKWKTLRRLKVIKVDLPRYNERPEDLSEEEIRSRLKEQGLLPPRPWMEKPVYISSTGSIFEPYMPPEEKTERTLPEVMHNIENKTINWKFLKNIELPRMVHARCTDVITKENIFGQVTVRFHTQQMLAVYDRFGRFMHGSEIIAKDVLEYVVFEKHLANEYGIWRIHDKIIPDWMPPKDPSALTYRKSPTVGDEKTDEGEQRLADV